MEIRPCTIADLVAAPNLQALLAEYAAESALQDLGAAHAQIDTYHQLEAVGAIHPLAAYDAGELIGFLILLISPLPHFGKIAGSSESFFVTASHRRTGAGQALLQAAEQLAQELGAAGMFVSAPADSRLARVMSRSSTYRMTNVVHFKALGNQPQPDTNAGD